MDKADAIAAREEREAAERKKKEMEEIMEYSAMAIFIVLVIGLLIYFGIEVYDHCKTVGCGR
mgnify:FL=1